MLVAEDFKECFKLHCGGNTLIAFVSIIIGGVLGLVILIISIYYFLYCLTRPRKKSAKVSKYAESEQRADQPQQPQQLQQLQNEETEGNVGEGYPSTVVLQVPDKRLVDQRISGEIVERDVAVEADVENNRSIEAPKDKGEDGNPDIPPANYMKYLYYYTMYKGLKALK